MLNIKYQLLNAHIYFNIYFLQVISTMDVLFTVGMPARFNTEQKVSAVTMHLEKGFLNII